MRIIAEATIRRFWRNHPDAEAALRNWMTIARRASWENPHDVVQTFPRASAIGDGRMVFRFGDYRMITYFSFEYYTISIKWIGTHDEYDEIDPETIDEH